MNRTIIARAIATALLGSSVLLTSVPALSQHHGEGHQRGARMGQMTEADRAQMRERMQARVSQRLDRLASRLEIKASQQNTWEAYRKARTSVFDTRLERPARDADAATVTKFRADMAQRRVKNRFVKLSLFGLQRRTDPNDGPSHAPTKRPDRRHPDRGRSHQL